MSKKLRFLLAGLVFSCAFPCYAEIQAAPDQESVQSFYNAFSDAAIHDERLIPFLEGNFHEKYTLFRRMTNKMGSEVRTVERSMTRAEFLKNEYLIRGSMNVDVVKFDVNIQSYELIDEGRLAKVHTAYDEDLYMDLPISPEESERRLLSNVGACDDYFIKTEDGQVKLLRSECNMVTTVQPE